MLLNSHCLNASLKNTCLITQCSIGRNAPGSSQNPLNYLHQLRHLPCSFPQSPRPLQSPSHYRLTFLVTARYCAQGEVSGPIPAGSTKLQAEGSELGGDIQLQHALSVEIVGPNHVPTGSSAEDTLLENGVSFAGLESGLDLKLDTYC